MTTSQFSVADTTTIVTGSSRGIGRAIATTFAADGANVVVCAPEDQRENLESVEQDINDDLDGRAISVVCDVTDRSDVQHLIVRTVEEFDEIDVLVNNAGGGHYDHFEETSLDDWNADIELNLTGAFNCTQLAFEWLRDGGGAVISISSGAGFEGRPGHIAYSAAKAGLVRLTEALSFEWAPYDVRVNAIAPGLIATERIVRKYPDTVPDPADIDRSRVERRIGTGEEIADIAQVLASPAASFVTGRTFEVAGVPTLERHLDVTHAPPDASGWVDAFQ